MWGGNLEILSWMLAAGRVGPSADFAGCVLLIETSEEMPPAVEVYRMLRNMGERGLLGGFPAILVGRAEELGPRAAARPCGEGGVRVRSARGGAAGAWPSTRRRRSSCSTSTWGTPTRSRSCPYGGQVRVDAAARTVSVLL